MSLQSDLFNLSRTRRLKTHTCCSFNSKIYTVMFNPYAQGGWKNAANSNAISSSTTWPQPSIFGALPYPTQNPPSMFVAFRFTSFSPSIFNSTVMGPQAKTYFRVNTDIPTPGFTVIANAANQPVIIIEWSKHPVLEIRGFVSKRRSSQWLELAPEKRCVRYCSSQRFSSTSPDIGQ